MKKSWTTSWALALTTLALFMSTGHEAAAEEARFRHLYGMVGATVGQSARLNVVNTLPPGPTRDELPPGPIRVRLALLDGDGRLIEVKRVELLPGQSATLDLEVARLGLEVGRVQLRAVVDVILPPGPSTDPSLSTLEIVDNDSARTSLFVHPAVIRGFNPQPDPPRE